MLRRLVRSATARAAAVVLWACLAVLLRTTRWRFVGLEHLHRVRTGESLLLAVWHERLALGPALWSRVRPDTKPGLRVHALVSRHRHGRLAGEVMQRFGLQPVHGSSARPGRRRDKGGASALRVLSRLLGDGAVVILTPDGPRGPRRRAAPGIATLAALSEVPVVPVAAQTSRHWRLPSWDRTVLPLPFGRGVVVCGPPVVLPDDPGAALAAIERALDAATDEADRLCGAARPAPRPKGAGPDQASHSPERADPLAPGGVG